MYNNYLLSNGLMISIDWISFTVEPEKVDLSVDDVIYIMGFKSSMIQECPHGARGYKRMRKHSDYDISVMYDGAENMGIHVNVTGSGVTALLSAFSTTQSHNIPFGYGQNEAEWSQIVFAGFMEKVLSIGHFTRLDIAIDDIGCQFYSCDDVVDRIEKGLVVTRFRKYENRCPKTMSGEKQGQTINIGSRKSSFFLRIYDKKLERNKNLVPDDDCYFDTEWTRWEMELKDDRANELAQLLISGQNLGKIAVAVLFYYFRIVQDDDINRSRCSNEPLWDKFVGNVEKLRLATPASVLSPVQKVLKKLAWVENQVGTSLFVLFAAYDCDYTFLSELITKSAVRLNSADWETIKSINPDFYHQYFVEE